MLSSIQRRSLAVAAFLLLTSCDSYGGSPSDPDETGSIIVSVPTVAMTEGVSETLHVSLETAPDADLTVGFASGGRVVVMPATLTFTPANFGTPQAVTLTAAADVDLDDATDSITVSATGLDQVIVPVSITDEDTLALVFSAPALEVPEGILDTFTVRLSHRPAADITFLVNRAQQAIVVVPPTLTFTPANWSTPQAVVFATGDDEDTVNGADTVYIAAVGDPHGAMPITIVDDDTLAILTDPGAALLDEGDSAIVAVRLSHRPVGPITVTLTSSDTAAVSVSPGSLQFTPANFDTPVNVVVRARQDANAQSELLQVALTAPGALAGAIGVRINDDD
jgi:hypothetical protein